MSTFQDVWRGFRAEMPVVPPLLARLWAQDGYNDLCGRWGWAFLRAESTIVTLASRTLSLTVVSGSTGIQGVFVASDAGRQVRVSGGPIYTIVSVGAGLVDATLDRAYTEAGDPAASATIFDAYVTMPADFRQFLLVIDRYNQRPIPFWFTEQQILAADPARIFSDATVRFLVARKYSAAVATLGQVQYEFWPYPSSARTYPFLYLRAAELLSDTSPLPGVLFNRPDILRTYLLARGSLWPGTPDQKNPAYSGPNAERYQAAYETEVQRLSLADDNEYPQQLQTIDWSRRAYGGLTMTGELLRQTDATVADYY